ncbi:MAG: hypothetical protein C4297_02060 [Gemmataceae bacterium]
MYSQMPTKKNVSYGGYPVLWLGRRLSFWGWPKNADQPGSVGAAFASPVWQALAVAFFCMLVPTAGCNHATSTQVSAPSQKNDASDPEGFFADRTRDSGLHFVYRNDEEKGAYAILESLGGGVGLLDYDRDGLLDILVTGGGYFIPAARKEDIQIRGYPNRLFRNLGNWRFQDVTEEVGLPAREGPFYSHGVAVADYDRDGWPDVLVTGYGRMALYHNVHGRFEEVTEKAGLAKEQGLHWSTSALWADFDGDGWPDLYVAHYVDWSFTNHPRCPGAQGIEVDVCSPKQFKPLPHRLYRNRGDGTFEEATARAGIKPGKGLGVIAADLNADGRPDIYVANDTEDNYLYFNRGSWRFDEVAGLAAVARDDTGTPNGSMGVDVADYDGSGRFSIFVTNYQEEAHALYRNLGDEQFHFVSHITGIKAIGLVYVGFGTGFLDFDNDGAEDIFIANGHVVRYPPPPGERLQPPVLLHNTRRGGGVFFRNVADQAGSYFRSKHMGRGVALGDLDNDGRVDLVITHTNEPVVLLQNVTANGHHWVGLQLEGSDRRDITGATIIAQVQGRHLYRMVKSGGSYLSSSDRRIVLGLGSATQVEQVTVLWPSPSGPQPQVWKNLAAGKYYRLREKVEQVDARPAQDAGVAHETKSTR